MDRYDFPRNPITLTDKEAIEELLFAIDFLVEELSLKNGEPYDAALSTAVATVGRVKSVGHKIPVYSIVDGLPRTTYK